jgi:hypothetical protein
VSNEGYWYPGGWFGESWGAPICEDEARHLDVPVGELCASCLEAFTEADQGMSMPLVYEAGCWSLMHEHIACFRRTVGASG